MRQANKKIDPAVVRASGNPIPMRPGDLICEGSLKAASLS
jgi:hypothetical protein